MAEEQLWFSHSVEGLFVRGLGDRLTPALRSKVLEAGIDVGKLKPAYPMTIVSAACRAIIPTLFPTLSEDQAYRELGVWFMRGYAQTLVGSAMVQMMRIIGPRRSLERMQKNFRSGGNYIQTRFTSLGPTSVELWLSDVTGMPGLYVGILEEGGRMVGAKNMRVVPVADVAPAFVMKVDWD